jgi:hypothetical protein
MYTDKISVKDYVDGLKEERTEKMQSLLKETSCNRIPNRFMIKKGVPFMELIETAKEEKVDMVILGRRAVGILPACCWGRRPRRCSVIARCRCSVFVRNRSENEFNVELRLYFITLPIVPSRSREGKLIMLIPGVFISLRLINHSRLKPANSLYYAKFILPLMRPL